MPVRGYSRIDPATRTFNFYMKLLNPSRTFTADGKAVLGRADAVNLFDLEQRLSRMGLDLVTGAPSSQTSRLIAGAKVRNPAAAQALIARLGG